ncbi:MAG TPA: methionyl-tRNA formyltransferase [Pirellulales bacterium]|jgi:methionyl-tRNA formyltransferase
MALRVIMMGTGPFAVPTFRALLASERDVLALVTRPPKSLHGKSQADVNPMRVVAQECELPIHEPPSVNTPYARAVLASYRPDVFVACDYGQILAPETLEIARLGGINLHASLLPKYRGAAPINWAIYRGETETGVTVIHMTPRVDAGPAIAQAATPIGAEEDAVELEGRLAELGVPLVLKALDELERGAARPIEQEAGQASRAPRLKKELGLVDWQKSAAEIASQVRALVPWPKTYTFWQRPGGAPLRVILEQVLVVDANGEPGTVLEAAGDRLVIAAGQGALAVNVIQPSGKRVMAAGEFLRGYPVRPGQTFGRIDQA